MFSKKNLLPILVVSGSAGFPPSNYVIPTAPTLLGVSTFGELIGVIFNYSFEILGIVIFIIFVWSGFMWLTAGGNPGTISKARSKMTSAILGAILLLSSYLILNTINPDLLDVGSFNLKGIKVPPKSGIGDGLPDRIGTGVGGGGTCSGVSCSGDTSNICGPVNPGDGCNVSAVNRHDATIRRGAGSITIDPSINTIKLLKAIIANESDGDSNKVASDGQSAGLFQLKPGTVNLHKLSCGISGNIDFNWLTNPANIEKQACVAANFLKDLAGICGTDVRQLAAGYNGGPEACQVSRDCGPAAGANQCTMCAGQTGPTRRWECLWDNTNHTVCNKERPGNFAATRIYAPRVQYCYSIF